jgi:pimeloyl-ACP methyl ester carboxylesterase
MLALLAGLLLAPQGTVVMIHGAGGGGWEYDLWKPVFEKAGWQVIARDLVPTKKGLAKTTFDDYLKQVVSWCPKDGRVVLIGASMGGILALKAAEKVHPERIVLVNSVPPLGVGSLKKGPQAPPIMRWANGPLKDTEDAMPDSDRKTVLWAWKRWRDESGQVMNAIRKGIPARRPDCPTLVVIGESDTDIPPKTSHALAVWAGATAFSYPQMSHVGPLMSKRAQKVAQKVLGWITAQK